MNTQKLQSIIDRENEDLEEKALHTAKSLISQIVQARARIIAAQKEIEECRKELKALEVTQLNPADVLGE